METLKCPFCEIEIKEEKQERCLKCGYHLRALQTATIPDEVNLNDVNNNSTYVDNNKLKESTPVIPQKKTLKTKNIIEWSDEYNIGIKNIDDQHRSIIEMINSINHTLIEGNRKPDFVSQIIKDLNCYIKDHFAFEEKLFIAAKYSEISDHKQQHRVFIKKIEDLNEEFKVCFVDLRNVLHILTSWFMEHIAVSDKGFARFWHDEMEKRKKG